jgi:quinol monooxygenase YgiN
VEQQDLGHGDLQVRVEVRGSPHSSRRTCRHLGSGASVDDSTFGIFDAFEDEAARQVHLAGQIPAALAQAGPELLARDPDIRLVDVLAVKSPG